MSSSIFSILLVLQIETDAIVKNQNLSYELFLQTIKKYETVDKQNTDNRSIISNANCNFICFWTKTKNWKTLILSDYHFVVRLKNKSRYWFYWKKFTLTTTLTFLHILSDYSIFFVEQKENNQHKTKLFTVNLTAKSQYLFCNLNLKLNFY